MRASIVMIAMLLPASLVFGQDTARFHGRVGAGTVSGTEEFTITSTASGHQVTGKIAMKRGGADASFTLRQSLTAEWATETYSVEMTGALGAAAVTAERRGDVLAIAVKTPAGTPAKDIPLKPRLVLMDNMLAAPYQVMLNVTGGKPGAFTVVVPFQLMTVEASLEAAGTAPGTLDGKPIVATKMLLKLASVTVEIYFDAASNRLLRVFVPSQDAELLRDGFAVAPGTEPKAAAPPPGVSERGVTFRTLDGAPYPAVVCFPKTPPTPPLVVMIQGSGPQDRDETIGPNKPFRDIAWGLAERGIATLRFDKRTYAFPTAYKGTLETESIEDGVEAVTFARTLADIDRTRVFVLGHSLGGLAAIYVAGRAPVAGLILMATAGRPMDLVIRDQVKTFSAGQDAAKVAAVLKVQDEIMARVRAGTASAQELQGQPLEAVRDMIMRDPIAEVQKTRAPLLVLKGDKDAQVFQPDFDALQAVATARPASEARLFSGLTHIFTATDGPAEFRAILQPGHVAPEVIEAIAGWIRKTPAGR